MPRRDVLIDLLTRHEADALLLTFLPDVRWACGFTGSNGFLLVVPDGLHFVSDGRYREQALREVVDATIHIPGHRLVEYAVEKRLLGDAATVVYQSDVVTVEELDRWRGLLPDVAFKGVPRLVTAFVASKTDEEVDRVRAAQAITDAVFVDLLDVIEPGMSEKDVAAEIVYGHLRRGAERMSFDPIVASGANGALPHARPTTKQLAAGDVLVLDFGCFLDGYASDMTRTIFLGEPGPRARHVYRVVREAQQRALDHARAGMTGKRLDGFAREVVMRAGLGACFTHGLGHGIGLQTHEWPRVSNQVEDILPEGVVVTIEPGVYHPGEFGVRIEDMVVLRADGCENLTASPKDMIVL